MEGCARVSAATAAFNPSQKGSSILLESPSWLKLCNNEEKKPSVQSCRLRWKATLQLSYNQSIVRGVESQSLRVQRAQIDGVLKVSV